MTATCRQIISVLLSLFLVMSGPVLAISEVAGGQVDSAMTDCGSMMMNQDKSATALSESDCVAVPDMTCPGSGGMNKCNISFSFALLPAGSNDLVDAGSQPVISARAIFYQDPFLASITPPPQHRS